MSSDIFTVEEERGTYTGFPRRHQGFYAGDFSQEPFDPTRPALVLAALGY